MRYLDRLSYTFLPMDDPMVVALPPFVVAKVEELLEREQLYQEEDIEHALFYGETNGCLKAKSSLKNISFWIASHDRLIHYICPPKARWWICPQSHYIHVEEISQELFPTDWSDRDPAVMWVVSDSELHNCPVVTKVTIVPEEEMEGDFPNMNLQR